LIMWLTARYDSRSATLTLGAGGLPTQSPGRSW
jgi:hypothetical protein